MLRLAAHTVSRSRVLRGSQRRLPLEGFVTGTVGLWGYIGIVLVLTGAVGFCPAYPILGINTCSMKKS